MRTVGSRKKIKRDRTEIVLRCEPVGAVLANVPHNIIKNRVVKKNTPLSNSETTFYRSQTLRTYNSLLIWNLAKRKTYMARTTHPATRKLPEFHFQGVIGNKTQTTDQCQIMGNWLVTSYQPDTWVSTRPYNTIFTTWPIKANGN